MSYMSKQTGKILLSLLSMILLLTNLFITEAAFLDMALLPKPVWKETKAQSLWSHVPSITHRHAAYLVSVLSKSPGGAPTTHHGLSPSQTAAVFMMPFTALDIFCQSQWSADLHSVSSTVSMTVPQTLVKLTFKIPSDTLPLKLGPALPHIHFC